MDNAARLIELAERVEAATGDMQARMLEEAWEACATVSADFRRFATSYLPRFDTQASRFAMCLDAAAYESAALTLVPEEYSWTLGQNVHHKHWLCSINYLNEDGAPACLANTGHSNSPALSPNRRRSPRPCSNGAIP
jgi:hypothetical protein